MEYIKKISKCLLYFLIALLSLSFILTILNYFDIINYKIIDLIKYIILFICYLISGYYIGYNSNKKGFIEGIKIGLIISVILILLNLIIFGNIKLTYLIYYLLLIGISTLGSIFGINKKGL